MVKNIKKAIGHQVRVARQQRGMTQEELAEKLDRSVEAVSNVERGVSLPSLDTLVRLSEALEVPLNDLLEPLESPVTVGEERYGLELQLRELGRSLSDRQLATAVELIRALKKQP